MLHADALFAVLPAAHSRPPIPADISAALHAGEVLAYVAVSDPSNGHSVARILATFPSAAARRAVFEAAADIIEPLPHAGELIATPGAWTVGEDAPVLGGMEVARAFASRVRRAAPTVAPFHDYAAAVSDALRHLQAARETLVTAAQRAEALAGSFDADTEWQARHDATATGRDILDMARDVDAVVRRAGPLATK